MWRVIEAAFEALEGQFRGRPNLRQVYAAIDTDAPEPGLGGERFEPGRSYFKLRLVELRLATAGRYLAEFVPMCTCVLNFKSAGVDRTIPFVVGVDMIRRLVGKGAAADAAKRIAFANLAVTDYVPVPGSDVTMYLSLCRFNDSSLVRGLLDLAAKTAAAVAGPAGGAMVKTATDFTGSLMNIFLADGVETRFGRLDGKALDRSGYRLLLASADPALDPKDLHIQDGQLLRRSAGQGASIDDVDYLMMAFEHRLTLRDETFSLLENLPFHKHWLAAIDAILRSKGAPDAAETDMTELRSAVLRSPDLTESDRLPLMQLYDTMREKYEVELRPKKKGAQISLVGVLDHAATIGGDRAGAPARLLAAAKTTIAGVVAAPPRFRVDQPPAGTDLVAMFDTIVAGQQAAIKTASPDDLTAAARAYVGAAARRR